jgi:Ca2+-transporting ATPase
MSRRPLPLARLPDDWRAGGGLAAGVADERRRRYGANDIVEAPAGGWLELARDTARDPMIWFLGATSAVYLAVGQRTEALTLLLAILPLVAMDAFLHRRTRASTEGLHSRLASTATVVRDDVPRPQPATAIVPGDLVLVAAGEPFPADGIVIDGADLQSDESILTGEAYPVAKRPPPALLGEGGEPLVEHEHWGFAGTRLLTGRASLRVVFTGGETLYGEIVRSAVSGGHPRTPLQSAIQSLVSVLVAAAAVMCLIMAWARLRQGYGWVDALVSAVTLASAALPEEFPVVFTFFLGVGVYRLARRHALVRRAVSVENIGRVSCICSDKTGTITQGRLHLAHLVAAAGIDDARLLALTALASRHDSRDPLDVAILRDAKTGAGSDRGEAIAVFPFTEGRRRETAIVRRDGGGLIAVAKGAGETVLAMCALSPAEAKEWAERMHALAAEGHRVIACAWRPLDAAAWKGEEVDAGYRFAGLCAFEDPVRAGVARAVTLCREAGIHTIMVTGDHPLTARAVAAEIGLGGARPTIVTGDQLEDLAARPQALAAVDVIARAAPAQKLALVRGLQAAGHIVAVTGDGVNDVPALQAADVGIAMGERGTRSAREVAAIVLLDDDFGTIVRAIGEGRQLFQNLRLAFEYLLMIHIPLVVTAALIPLAGYPLLYLPIHIVWLEMIIHPSALLVFQDMPASERIARVAAHGRARFFSPRDWVGITAVGAFVTALVVAGFLVSLSEDGDVAHGRAMALATLTFSSAAITAALSRLRTATAQAVAGGTVALSLSLLEIPPVARLLHLGPLHAADLVLSVAGAVAAGLLALAVSARWSRRRSAAPSAS